ncbi:MAG: methylcobamide:CoM methyltransferase MtaA [Deferrisomatales bacterium]
MTSRERVERVFRGETPDRVPVLPQVGDHAGWVAGLTMDQIYHDAKKIAEAHVKAYRRYGYDILAIQVEPSWPVAEACGCTVTYPPEKCPWITENVIRGPEDVDKVRVPDFMAHSGTRTILEATRRLKEQVGGEAVIAGYMTGPLTFALQLMPYNDFILKTRKDPTFVAAVVGKAGEVAQAFVAALREAGADICVTCEHDLQMLAPSAFTDYILPNLSAITSVLPYNVLHVCGKVEAHLTQCADEIAGVPGLQFVNFSAEVPILKMVEVFGDRMGLCGNIDHIHLLTAGTPEEVQAACKAAIEDGRKAKAFMLGPGCEITTDTPPENIVAFVQSAALYGGYG